MPQIAQQDYKVIAPKYGRNFSADAAALAELKKSVLSGVAFDCLLEDQIAEEGTHDRILGIYKDGMVVAACDTGNGGFVEIELPYTVKQYEGLSAVQLAEDEHQGKVVQNLPIMESAGSLIESNSGDSICVDGKYLTITGNETIEALTIAEDGPSESFIDITWEDAQKLIGLPLA